MLLDSPCSPKSWSKYRIVLLKCCSHRLAGLCSQLCVGGRLLECMDQGSASHLTGFPESGSALRDVMWPSCGGRLAKSLSARSSSARLRLHAASGKLVSLHEPNPFEGVSYPSMPLRDCSSRCMSNTSERAQRSRLEKAIRREVISNATRVCLGCATKVSALHQSCTGQTAWRTCLL